MSQEVKGNNVELEDSIIRTSRETLTSENNSTEIETESAQESKVEEKIPFLEPLKTNRFLLVRGLYYVLRSIWIVAMIVGGFIAWIISLLFI